MDLNDAYGLIESITSIFDNQLQLYYGHDSFSMHLFKKFEDLLKCVAVLLSLSRCCIETKGFAFTGISGASNRDHSIAYLSYLVFLCKYLKAVKFHFHFASIHKVGKFIR